MEPDLVIKGTNAIPEFMIKNFPSEKPEATVVYINQQDTVDPLGASMIISEQAHPYSTWGRLPITLYGVTSEAHAIKHEESETVSFRDRLLFKALVDSWHTERRFSSWVDAMVSCPSYLSIIEMGPRALPLILAKMKSEGDDPDHWFEALEAITYGVDPVPEMDRGNMVKMAQAWFDWAERRNVLY